MIRSLSVFDLVFDLLFGLLCAALLAGALGEPIAAVPAVVLAATIALAWAGLDLFRRKAPVIIVSSAIGSFCGAFVGFILMR